MATIVELANKEYNNKLNEAINECKSQLLTNEEWVEIINHNKNIRGFQTYAFGEVRYLASNGVFVRVASINETPEGIQPNKAYATLSTDLSTAITSASSALAVNVNNISSKLKEKLETVFGNVITLLYDVLTGKTYLSEEFINSVKEELIREGAYESGFINFDISTEQDMSYILENVVDYNELKNYIDYSNYNDDGVDEDWGTQSLTRAIQQAESTGGLEIYHLVKAHNLTSAILPNYTQATYVSITGTGKVSFDNGFLYYNCNSEESIKISISYSSTNNIKSPYQYTTTTSGKDKTETITRTGNGSYQLFPDYGEYWTNFGKIVGEDFNKKTGIYPQLGVPISTTYPNWSNNSVQGDTYKPDPDDPNKIKNTTNNYYPTTIIKYPKDNEDINKEDKEPDDYTQAESQTGESDDKDVQDSSDNATDDEIQQGVIVPTGKANYDLGKTASTTGHKLFNPVSTFFSIPYKFNMGSEGSKMLTISSWLWSDSGLKELLKFFANDPFQAIISCKAIPCPCTVASGEYPVVFGSLQVPNVTAKVITERMHVVNCGSLSIDEHFENCMDFAPYSSVSMYLPFIGIVSLEIDDIMGGIITVSYNVDTITGDAICNVTISRNEMIAVLYQYPCNVSVDIPISGADYSAKWSGAVAGLGSLAAGLVMKKPAMAVSGLVGGALALSKGGDVQRSGQLTGNTGALGFRRPYLIINRPVPDTTYNFEKFQGIGSHQNVYIKNLTGYNRCKEVHVDGISNATNSEKDMIESVLKGGFIL